MYWKKLDKLEHIVDWLIPLALIAAILLIIIEFLHPEYAEKYIWVDIVDATVIVIFFFDLCFKYHHSKTIPMFLKNHWFEILAIFPFFLIFRLLDGLGFLSFATAEVVAKEGQSLVHTGTEIEKEAVAVSRLTRAQKLVRFLRPIFETPRTVHATRFYEHPKHRNNLGTNN